MLLSPHSPLFTCTFDLLLPFCRRPSLERNITELSRNISPHQSKHLCDRNNVKLRHPPPIPRPPTPIHKPHQPHLAHHKPLRLFHNPPDLLLTSLHPTHSSFQTTPIVASELPTSPVDSTHERSGESIAHDCRTSRGHERVGWLCGWYVYGC